MITSVAPFILGIAGGTGSGKTALSIELRQKYFQVGICLIEQDSYYLDRSHLSAMERTGINYDEPQAIDHDLLLQHLAALSAGRPIEKPVYCFETHTRKKETEVVNSAPLILIEGLFALWDARIRSLMDFRIFVEADPDIRLIRRCRRDVLERGRTMDSVIDQYLNSVRPMHYLYIEPTKASADLVIHNNGDMRDLVSPSEEAIARVFEERKRIRRTD